MPSIALEIAPIADNRPVAFVVLLRGSCDLSRNLPIYSAAPLYSFRHNFRHLNRFIFCASGKDCIRMPDRSRCNLYTLTKLIGIVSVIQDEAF